MEKENFYRLIEDKGTWDAATAEELRKVLQDAPYFQSARMLYAKCLQMLNDEQYADELAKTAVFCADRKRLYYYIHSDEYAQFVSHAQDTANAEDRTQALLDAFLASLEENEAEISSFSTVTDPTMNIISTDYLSYLESLGETPQENTDGQALKHQEIIDSFIQKSENEQLFAFPEKNAPSTVESADNEMGNDAFLTETLARIYIKQKKYEQALTIIKRLSLNFPKKSVYFADQIRFLEHLIRNEQFKNN